MSSQSRPRIRNPLTLRRVLFQVHLWIGLILSIPFAILGITDSYLVYDQDFETVPAATAQGAFAAPAAILAAGAAGRDGFVPASITMPAREGLPAVVRLARAQQPGAEQARGGGRGGPGGPGGAFGGPQIYVDPVSLEVLGERGRNRTELSDFNHQLHGSLQIGGREGRSVVGWLGVGMTLLGITGIVLWWPRNGRFGAAFTVKSRGGYPLHRQLHGAVGIWGWAIFVVVCFSGVAISFPQTISAMVGAPAPQGGPFGGGGAQFEPIPGGERISLERGLEVARERVGDLRLTAAFLPMEADQPMRANFASSSLRGVPQVNVSIDPYRGSILTVRDPREVAGSMFMGWQRPLHDGQGLGFIYKALVFLSGLMPPLFMVTGTAMWWIKRKRKAANAPISDDGLEGAPAE